MTTPGTTELSILPMITEAGGEYRVNLPLFEGPFDLLLYLIRRHDLDIHDIPIARLTEEYLNYLESMRELDIDLAGEFLVMASELMHVKSQLLLPVTPNLETEEADDPRADLVRRLMEYQRYKEAAAELERRPMLWRDVHVPSPSAEDRPKAEAPLAAGNVFLLVESFHRVLARAPRERIHTVQVDRISVNQRVMELWTRLEVDRTVALEDLLATPLTRYSIVITFLALLEMARMNAITLFQAGAQTPVYVTRRPEAETPDLAQLTFS